MEYSKLKIFINSLKTLDTLRLKIYNTNKAMRHGNMTCDNVE